LSKVTRVKEGGSAHQAGVIPGDYVVGAGGRMITDFDELMRVVPHMERPLYLALKRPPELIATAGHVSIHIPFP
jgi:predicted metalloprotease with PDZ domain